MVITKRLQLMGAYFFRWIGFPVEPQLIEIGKPTTNSPVLLTCNFCLTVHRVLKNLKNLDCYLLVAPSNGINVWCGACGDDFNTNSVLSILKTTNIGDKVTHRTLILPQLSAPGINPKKIKLKTGWNVKFGPVYAKDIPSYIEHNFKKTEAEREVRFPLSQRIEMGNLYFFMLFLLITLIYWIGAIFMPFLNLILYIHSTLILVITIHGSMIILPSINIQKGYIKIILYGSIILTLIAIYNLILKPNIFYFTWDIILASLILLIMGEDFHGLTPIYKSELGERSWKKGKKTMKFLFSEYKLSAYGDIRIKEDDCIGCKLCIEVCPRLVFKFDANEKKAKLLYPNKCINCHACINQCLGKCLSIH
ncbi:MAG: HgcAB-like fusion protein [Promethearchaeota archaeon]